MANTPKAFNRFEEVVAEVEGKPSPSKEGEQELRLLKMEQQIEMLKDQVRELQERLNAPHMVATGLGPIYPNGIPGQQVSPTLQPLPYIGDPPSVNLYPPSVTWITSYTIASGLMTEQPADFFGYNTGTDT